MPVLLPVERVPVVLGAACTILHLRLPVNACIESHWCGVRPPLVLHMTSPRAVPGLVCSFSLCKTACLGSVRQLQGVCEQGSICIMVLIRGRLRPPHGVSLCQVVRSALAATAAAVVVVSSPQ